MFIAVAVPVVGWLLVNWLAALLATVVVWPTRAISGRWPVVAYLLGPADGDDRLLRVQVHDPAQAQTLANQWAMDIKRQGHPRPPVG